MDIFENQLAMDYWCYDIIEAWIEYRKKKGKTYTQDDWDEYIQENIELSLSCNFQDCIEEE